jgi:hypothetical protein
VKPIFDFLQSRVCSIMPGYKGNPNGSFLKNMINALLSQPPDVKGAILLVAHALANALLVLSKLHILPPGIIGNTYMASWYYQKYIYVLLVLSKIHR